MIQLDPISISFLDNSNEGIYILDKDRKIIYCNAAAEKITEYLKEELTGKSCTNSIHSHENEKGQRICGVDCPVLKTFNEGKKNEMQSCKRNKSGNKLSMNIRTSPIKDDKGEIIGAIQFFTDNKTANISQEKLNELIKYSFLDTVTGIPNRRYVEKKLIDIIEAVKNHNTEVLVVVIEVQNLKELNDKMGAKNVDMFLKNIADIVKCNIQPKDILSRWSGNRLIIVRSETNRGLLNLIINKIKMSCDKVTKTNGDLEFSAETVFVGTMIHPVDNLESLLSRLERLLQEAKAKNIPFMVD